MYTQSYLILVITALLLLANTLIGVTDLYKYVDDEDENDVINEIEITNDGETINALDLEELENEIEQELNVKLKRCPHPTDDKFEATQQDFIDLLMATEFVNSAELSSSSETFWKFHVSSQGVKLWNSYMTVMAMIEGELWIMLQCEFTPESQMKMSRKYIFANEWNKETFYRPHLFVQPKGSVTLERTFSINQEWKWGMIYNVFSMEVTRYLESIDLMQSQLRIEEDASLK